MYKLLNSICYLAIVVGILFACKKEPLEANTHARQDPVSALKISNGMLEFKDREHYDAVIDVLEKGGDASFPAFEKRVGFKSLRSSLSTIDTSKWDFSDPLFFTLLSPEGYIMIKDHIFKIDFENEKGSVFTKSGAARLSAAQAIMSFEFDENALDVLYPETDNSDASRTSGSRCANEANKDVKGDVTGASPSFEAYELKNVYQSAVLCFSLQAKIKSPQMGGYNVAVQTRGWYNPKGTSSVTNFQHRGPDAQYESSVRSYSGSKCLSSYNCQADYFEFAPTTEGGTRMWTMYNNQ